MLKLVLACAPLVAGWNHLASFNDNCGAGLSFLRGTELEASATVGKIPYQFKTAFAEVLKARVASEGCTLTPQQQALFYGLEPINFLRLIDAYDTELNNTAFPCTNVANLKWSWQNAKKDIQGILLPTSCRSANFATTKQCNGKFRIVDNLYAEFNYADKCTDPNQAGFGLPQITLSCSGSMCATLGRPCVPGVTDCGTGTCHTFTDSNLNGTLQFLLDTGLFSNLTDTLGCTANGFSFPEQFFSDIMNNVAQMVGLTTTMSTQKYSAVSLCGVGEIDRRFNPSKAPTPVPQFRCDFGTLVSFGQVCNGVNDCPGGEDEAFCRCNSSYPGMGMIDSNNYTFSGYSCCPICPDENYNNGNNGGYYCSNQYCSLQSGSSGSSVQICNSSASGWGLECSDLSASTPQTIPAASQLSSVSSSNPNEHILGFADCDGNVQIGNTNDMIVGNAKLPLQKVLARAEAIIKGRETCRQGTAAAAADWKRTFFPWAVNFWGGTFFGTQSSANVYNNVNPGVKIDDSLRYYSDVSSNSSSVPPFSNVMNLPVSCDATTTGNGVCEIAMNIGEWFGGDFPAGWNSATTVHLKLSSTCSSSALPSGLLTCEGPCTASSKSGCCIAKEPFLPSTNFACPAGYVLDTLESDITDFLFNMTSTRSKDVTLMNFVTLVATRTSGFGNGAGMTPFISAGLGTNTQFCRINGSSFPNNTEAWANKTVTDRCPYPPGANGNGTRSCPQILSGGGVVACNPCLSNPTVNTCPASGCPQTPVTPTTPTTNSAVAAGVSVVAMAVAMLALY